MSRILYAVPALALAFFCALPAGAQVHRVFVASTGSDGNTVNNCHFTLPCRTFAAAMTRVNAGGEVVALDAAGYAPVTITKSVTITANPGFFAGIAADTGNAVTIATAGVNVTLRNLSINGVGGTNGVVMTAGAQLSIENCVISNFSAGGGKGVSVSTDATVRVVDSLVRENFHGVYVSNGATATIARTKFLGNTEAGVYVHGNNADTTTAAISDAVFTNPFYSVYTFSNTGAATARSAITRSTIANGGVGPASEATSGTAVTTISNSMITGNGLGYSVVGAGTVSVESLGNNTFRQNGGNTGVLTPVALQ